MISLTWEQVEAIAYERYGEEYVRSLPRAERHALLTGISGGLKAAEIPIAEAVEDIPEGSEVVIDFGLAARPFDAERDS